MELAPGFLMLRDRSKSRELKEDARRIGIYKKTAYCVFRLNSKIQSALLDIFNELTAKPDRT